MEDFNEWVLKILGNERIEEVQLSIDGKEYVLKGVTASVQFSPIGEQIAEDVTISFEDGFAVPQTEKPER